MRISNPPCQPDKGVYTPILILIETGKLNKKRKIRFITVVYLNEDFIFFAFQRLLKPEERAETQDAEVLIIVIMVTDRPKAVFRGWRITIHRKKYGYRFKEN